MRFLSYQTRYTWSFILVIFVLLIGLNTYLSRATILELTGLQTEISKSSTIVNLLSELHVELLTIESGQRGYLLTKEMPYLNNYQDAVKRIIELKDAMRNMQSSDNDQAVLLKQLLQLLEDKLEEMESTIVLAEQNRMADAITIVDSEVGLELYFRLRGIFNALKANEVIIRDKQISELKHATEESQRNLIISFVTSIVLVIGIFYLAKVNVQSQLERQIEIEQQNEKLAKAVAERTRELSIYSEELSRSNRELEDFAFVASHDLQEPLRKIMAFGDRLESDADDFSNKQLDYLQRMRSAASRMSTLISDLLEFSRVNTRGKPFQKVALNTIVEESIDDLSVLIEESGAQIDTADLPTIDADPTQMKQLFFNLIANGVKFSQQTETPQVNIQVKKTQKPNDIKIMGLEAWYEITVIDNGIGFEQEYADKIFAPFQRLHSRKEFKGTGIGLAICRRIVERHNGVISAIGEVGKGATFTIILPAVNHLISSKT